RGRGGDGEGPGEPGDGPVGGTLRGRLVAEHLGGERVVDGDLEGGREEGVGVPPDPGPAPGERRARRPPDGCGRPPPARREAPAARAGMPARVARSERPQATATKIPIEGM